MLCLSHRDQSSKSSYIPKWKKSSVAKCETLSLCLLRMQCIKASCKMTCYMMCGQIKGARPVPENYWTSKTTSQNVQLHVQVNQQKKKKKKKRGNKSQMRAEFKLRYKGFKSSGSLFFEDTYLHTTPVCQNSTRHMIVSFRSPGIGMFIESSCYTASYSQVPLSFKTHCKSLLSLEWQIVPCLQHSSMAGDAFWVPECKSFGFFLRSPAIPATLGQ